MRAIATDKLDEAKISASECELLRFTGRVNSESSKIGEGDVQLLRDLKWHEEQIAEAVHVTAITSVPSEAWITRSSVSVSQGNGTEIRLSSSIKGAVRWK